MTSSSKFALLATVVLSLAWIAPALAQDDPTLASEQPQFEAETIPLYRVERTKTLLVQTRGRARAIILSPEVVEVERISENHIVLRGLQIGSSLVHLFDSSGRVTIRIETTELISIVDEIKMREERAIQEKLGVPERSLKVRYRGTQRHLERGEDTSLDGKDERFRIRTHDVLSRMSTPVGGFEGKMFLEQRRDVDMGKEVTQPRHLSAELQDVNMGALGPSDLVLGDRDLNLSNFTIDGRRYRGVGIFPATPFDPYYAERPALDRQVAVSAFTGEERQGYGLDLPAGLQTREDRSNFAGTKVAYRLWETGHVYMTGLQRYGDGGELRSDQVGALGLNSAWGERLWIKGEAARNADEEGAYELEGQYQLTDWLKTRNRMWQVGKNYRTVTGGVAEDGQTGWRGWLGADMMFWDLPGLIYTDATIYKDRNALNPVNPEELNTLYSIGASNRLPWKVSSQLAATYEDQSGSPLPYVHRRYDASLLRDVYFDKGWLRSLAPFIGYRHSLYEKSNVDGYNAVLDLYRTGVRASFVEGYWGAITWSEGRLEEEIPETHPAVIYPNELAVELGKNHVFKVIPAVLNLSVRYEDVQNTNRKTHQPFPDRDRFSADGRFSWRFGKEKEAFAELSVSRQKPEVGPGGTIVDIFVQFGVQFLWDTGFTISQKGSIAGVVFIDLNGNGEREPTEPGLPGVRVFIEGGPESVTRKDGQYLIKGIPEGVAVVRVDTDQIPKGYFFTTANTQQKLVLPRKQQQVDFGVSTQVEFRGIVFNDMNEDLVYQRGADFPVQGVRMLLESGQSAVSGPDGFYWIRKVLPGEHTVSVDVSTVPDGYRTLIPVQKKFQSKEGEIVQHDLPLKAQRSVWGTVFVDADNNSGRGPAEKGLPNIRVFLDGQEVKSDADGAFRFSNVPPGRYTIRVEPADLPEGHKFVPARTQAMDVPPGPFLRERFDLPVVPADAPEPPELPAAKEPAPSEPAPSGDSAPSEPAPGPVREQRGPSFSKDGLVSEQELTKRFPGVKVPPGTAEIYLMPPQAEPVTLYVPDTIRPVIEQRIAREQAALPEGMRLQLKPLPVPGATLRRPGLLIQDPMLESGPARDGLPVLNLYLGDEPPPLAALMFQALKGEPGPQPPPKVLGAAGAREAAGGLYWIWFLEE